MNGITHTSNQPLPSLPFSHHLSIFSSVILDYSLMREAIITLLVDEGQDILYPCAPVAPRLPRPRLGAVQKTSRKSVQRNKKQRVLRKLAHFQQRARLNRHGASPSAGTRFRQPAMRTQVPTTPSPRGEKTYHPAIGLLHFMKSARVKFLSFTNAYTWTRRTLPVFPRHPYVASPHPRKKKEKVKKAAT